MSSLLVLGTIVTGGFSIALGLVHIWVPRIFVYRMAIGADGRGVPALGPIRFAGWAYERRRSDLVGLAWVMSNAASYVLVSIGIVDLAWAIGDRTIPVGPGAVWMAGWWGLRALGQFAVGRRPNDIGIVALFLALAGWHLALLAAVGEA